MSHHLRYFRFSNRTQIEMQDELKMEDFFSENEPKEETLRVSSRPKKSEAKTEEQRQTAPRKQASTTEQILIESSNRISLPDDLILRKIVEKEKSSEQNDQNGRVFIFPTLQFNIVGFREDETTFTELLKFMQDPANNLKCLKLATGYLNLQKSYSTEIGKLPGECDILVSSPQANSFYKGGSFKKYIPGLYRLNAINLLKRTKNVNVHEYTNGDWTYHAKGAWAYEKDEEAGPVMTVIGSSNFSHRSNRRDTEVQLYVISECDSFKKRLHDECEELFANSQKVDISTLKKDSQYEISWKDKMIRKVFGMML